MPRNNYYFCSRNNVGNLTTAGLPNITGQTHSVMSTSSNYSGALDNDSLVSEYGVTVNTTASVKGRYIKFDASKSNSIYGNSITVQPLSINCYLEFYIN